MKFGLIIKHISSEECTAITETSTVLFEDNSACIEQIEIGYIKGDRTKHISPKFFYTHEIQKNDEIVIHQICSSDNLADLFTKSLLTSTFERFVSLIGMPRLKVLSSSGGAN